MKNIKKIMVGSLVILLIISAFSSNPIQSASVGDGDDGPTFLFPGILSVFPAGRDFGALQEGDTRTVTFIMENSGITDNSQNIQYLDIEWSISIPDLFTDHITVSPDRGILTPGTRNPKTGELEYDENHDCEVTVNLDTAGLTTGSYKCDIEFFDLGYPTNKFFSVKFSIGAVLQYSPSTKILKLGKPETEEFTFRIWNGGFGTLNYNFDYSCYKVRYIPISYQAGIWPVLDSFNDNWISFSKTSGSSNGENDYVTVIIDTSTLQEWTIDNSIPFGGGYYPGLGVGGGIYKCIVDIDSNGVLNNGEGIIEFTVYVGPEIGFSFEEGRPFDFGDLKRGDIKNTTFQIYNKHPGNLTWEIIIPGEIDDYVTLTTMNGVSTGPDDPCNVTVTIDTTVKIPDDVFPAYTRGKYCMMPGYHEELIAIKSNDPQSFHIAKNKGAIHNPYDSWPCFNFEYYLSLCNNSDNYDMVIITADYLKDFPHSVRPLPGGRIEDLAEAHRVIDGYNVTIKTVKEIYDDYRNYYLPDGVHSHILSSRNSQEVSLCIREFLRDAYFHWENGSEKAFYVLLVGDDDWNMVEKYSQEWAHYSGIPWEYYYENLDTKWLKVGNLPPGEGETGNKIDLAPGKDNQYTYFSWGDDYYWDYSVEVPTFQVPTGKSSSSSGGDDSGDDYTGWKSYFFNLRNLNIQGGNVELCIQTLYPYTEDYDSDGNGKNDPRNLYVNWMTLHNTSLGYDSDEMNMPGGNIEDYIDFNEEDYHGQDCNKINYKDNPFGLRATMTSDEEVGGLTVNFYDHPEDGYDTFIVYANGLEIGRYDDDGGTPFYPGDDPFTSASDLPYASLGDKYNPKLSIIENSYCSIGDTVPDVFVGRAPIRSAEELENFVRKTIEYMESPVTDEYLNAVVASEYLGLKSHKNWEVTYLGQSNYDSGVAHGTVTFNCAWKNLTVDGAGVGSSDDEFGLPGGSYSNYETVGIPSDIFNIIKLHDKWVYLNGQDYGSKVARIGWLGHKNFLSSSSAISLDEVINDGVGIINHMGHSRRSKPISNNDVYEVLRLSKHDIEDGIVKDIDGNILGEKGLKNTVYPVVFSLGCYGGQFDNPYTRQIGELLLVDENGMVAGVFNGMMMPGDEYEEAKYDRYFWHQVFGKGKAAIGEAFNGMKKDAGNSNSHIFYGLNLYGDPALKIKGVEDIPPVANDDFVEVENNTYDNIIDVLDNDVLPEAPGPILAFNPSSSDFDLIGRAKYETSFGIWNHGSDTLDYSISMSCKKARALSGGYFTWDDYGCDWIQLSQTTGSSTGEKDTIDVTFDTTDLPTDVIRDTCKYVVYITISSNGENRYSNTFTLRFEVGDDPVVDPVPSETEDTYNLDSMYETYIESFITPLHGDLVINGNLLEYTPDPGYCGSDTFEYTMTTARDLGNSGIIEKSDDARVYITVIGVNDPPVVADIPDQMINEDDSFNVIFLDDFVVDAESLDEEIIWSVSGNSNLSVDIVDRVATVSYPLGWHGNEMITFTATDSGDLSDSDDATFTVIPIHINYPPVFSEETPLDNSENVPVSIDSLSITIEDPEGDNFNWTIESIPPHFYGIGTREANGTKTAFSQIDCCMPYNTTFIWYVNATDSGSSITTSEVYTFTTESNPGINHPPDKPINPTPLNDSINQSISLSLSVDVFDPDNDNLNVTFYIDDVSVGTDNLVISGQSASTDVELEYNTSYSWYAIADDGQYTNQSDTWIFTTKENNTEDPVEEPTVEIIKPLEGMLYVRNELKRNFVMTTTIGDIDIEAVVLDPSGTNVETVKFYIDEDELVSIPYDPLVTNYNFSLSDRMLGMFTIKVAACDVDGDEIIGDEIDVLIFNLGLQ